MTALFHSLQFFLISVPIAILAPIFYWLAGLPLGYATKKMEWALLWGVGLVGLTGELACMAGIPAKIATLVVAGGAIAGGFFIIRSKAFGPGGLDLKGELRANAESYLISLLAVSFVPFILPSGNLGGDWLLSLDSGQYIAEGKRFYPLLLARPALFGAASIPICIFGNPLASFQVFCAVASACIFQVVRFFIPPAGRPSLIWLLGGSVFFLHLTANAWAKFLAAAFVVAAWNSVEIKERHRHLTTGALLGLALTTHQASVLFVPLALARIWNRTPSRHKFVRDAVTVLATAAVICMPWELYTIVSYGLNAKIQANPSVAVRIKDLPIWLNALLVGVATFFAWGPFAMVEQWIRGPWPQSPAQILKEIYWVIVSCFDALAGSVAGIVAPWLAALRLKRFSACLFELWTTIPPMYRCMLALSLVGQMLLNPWYSPGGSLQTGWVPAGVAAICWMMVWVSRRSQAEQTAVIRSTLFFGIIPWAAFNFILTAGLLFSTRLKEQIASSPDEFTKTISGPFMSLGLGAFPWIQVTVLVGLAILYSKKVPIHSANLTAVECTQPDL